jgi:hypothetical protein
MTQNNNYLGCRPLNEKLSDQPKKYRLFAEAIILLSKLPRFEKYRVKN